MELSVVYSRALAGIEAPLVQVETHLSNGLPAFHIVGLPETAVRESKDRVRSAILNSHFSFPDRRITINLAPADLPKEGGPLRPAHRPGHTHRFGPGTDPCAGTPRVSRRTGPGRQPAAGTGRDCGGQRLQPGRAPAGRAADSAALAALAPGSRVIPAADLLTLCAHLNGSRPISQRAPALAGRDCNYPDLRDVVGQQWARRALEIAASGDHDLLLVGPPGTGKTLLASRLPGILPPPGQEEALTLLALRDIFDPTDSSEYFRRPFRNPHHSATAVALAGGGSKPRPGEISLAHGGVLFLDELAEFSRHSLEVLREPMESGEITLSRASHRTRYPARFQLVAAMNPCPCGYLGDPDRACRCTPEQIQRYRARVSGPLLDRIDLHVGVYRLPPAQLLDPGCGNEASSTVRSRVCHSRRIQEQRQGCANARIPPDRLAGICQLGRAQRSFLESAALQMSLSGRAIHRTLRVARTIADLAASPDCSCEHIGEALAYRGANLPG